MKAVSRTPTPKTEAAPEFYVPGGALNPDAPSYILRAADEELPRALLAGEYCYVLTPRQMGKSSLMYRTADALKREGVRSVTIDLTGIGTGVTEDQWYLGHLLRIKKDLKLAIDYLAWWRANGHLGAVQRFGLFLTDVALREIAEPIVIFIDEIDTTLNLAYSDDYFAAIRSLHIQRANDPELRRLRFVLLGVASPSDLIKDANRTPFNIGRRIALGDFTLDEMAPLMAGLAPDPAMAGALLKPVVRWTGGHPFLTQTACRRVAEWVRSPKFRPSEVPAIVDDLVRELFISESGRNKDPNLQFVRDRILEHERAVPLLGLYRQIRRGETITDDELDPLRAALKLSGLIVTTDSGLLQVRNRIYSTVFDDVWVSVSIERKGGASEPKKTGLKEVLSRIVSPFIPERQRFDYDVFISYSSRDREFAEYLLKNLTSSGLRCFVASEDIGPGTPWIVALESALTQSRNILVVLSPGYLASDLTARELDLAFRLRGDRSEVRLIPLLLRETEIPAHLLSLQYIDFRKRSVWNQSMELLLDALSPNTRIQLADPLPAPAERYNSAVVRELLETAFDEEDLTALAYDYFRPIYRQLRIGKPKKAMVQEIIEYFDQNGNYDQLLDAIARTRPREYRSFAPRLERPAANVD
jgi:hypothetical protein